MKHPLETLLALNLLISACDIAPDSGVSRQSRVEDALEMVDVTSSVTIDNWSQCGDIEQATASTINYIYAVQFEPLGEPVAIHRLTPWGDFELIWGESARYGTVC